MYGTRFENWRCRLSPHTVGNLSLSFALDANEKIGSHAQNLHYNLSARHDSEVNELRGKKIPKIYYQNKLSLKMLTLSFMAFRIGCMFVYVRFSRSRLCKYSFLSSQTPYHTG